MVHPDVSASRLREHDLLKVLIDGITGCAVFLLDADGRIATWNTGAARIKGYAAEEVIGKPIAMFYPEENAAKGDPACALAIAAQQGRYETQGWRLRKDGSRFWADVVIDAIRDDRGHLQGFATITRDHTEQKIQADELRASEAQYKLLVDAVEDYGIFWLDADGRVSSWNAGAQRIKGYTAREIVGRSYSVFFTPEDRKAGLPERALREAKSWGRFLGEGWRVRKDGSRFWASAVVDRICDTEGKLVGFAKITRDDTERRHADIALREAHALLEQRVIERTRDAERRAREAEEAQADARAAENVALEARERAMAAAQAKSRFFAAASHDLRQPIQALRFFLDVLDARLGHTEHQPIMEQLSQALTSTEDILASFVDIARIDSGAIVPRFDRVALADVLTPLVEQLAAQAAAKGLALRYVRLDRQVETDPTLLRRIVQNLIENAVKYTLAGKILVGCRRRGQALVIEVWDTGPGIEKQHRQRIWDEFYQVDNPARTRSGGLGLGLSIVQKLATALGHRLELKSEVGKGSVFRVILE
jgi:PAS domain S-box-containing protein